MSRNSKMMKPGGLLLVLCMMGVLTACGSKKVMVKNDTLSTAASHIQGTNDDALQKLAFVQKVTDNQVYAANIVGKMNFEIQADGNNISVPGSLHMRKDKVIRIQLFIPLLGSEVGRLEFTPSYVLIIDRIHKQYVKADYTQLDFLRNNGLSFYSLQALFWNQLMLPGTEKLSNSDLRKFEVDLSTPDATVPLTVSNGKMNYRWLTNKDNGRIAEAHVKYESKTDGVSRLDWKYTDFRPVGVKMFPASQAFSFTTAKGNKNHEATVTIRMDEVKTSSDWEEQSTVSDKYKKMDASDVLGKILSM